MSRAVLQVAALRKEVEEIDKQVAEAERMLKLADPGVLLSSCPNRHVQATATWPTNAKVLLRMHARLSIEEVI